MRADVTILKDGFFEVDKNVAALFVGSYIVTVTCDIKNMSI
jgi:hypothetical protein